MIQFCDDHSLELSLVSWKKEFTKEVEKFDSTVPFFIYQLDMLVPDNLTVAYNFYNVHRGDMWKNRGPNPDVWPILLGEDKTAISLHRINQLVDSGLFIDAVNVEIDENDHIGTIKDKQEAVFPQLVDSFYRYLTGDIEGIDLQGGTYHPWVKEEDFTIDLQKDSLKQIKRKVNSQIIYNGAIVELSGQKKYVNKYEFLDSSSLEELFITDYYVDLPLEDGCLRLYFNNSPKFAPPPVKPPSKKI